MNKHVFSTKIKNRLQNIVQRGCIVVVIDFSFALHVNRVYNFVADLTTLLLFFVNFVYFLGFFFVFIYIHQQWLKRVKDTYYCYDDGLLLQHATNC